MKSNTQITHAAVIDELHQQQQADKTLQQQLCAELKALPQLKLK